MARRSSSFSCTTAPGIPNWCAFALRWWLRGTRNSRPGAHLYTRATRWPFCRRLAGADERLRMSEQAQSDLILLVREPIEHAALVEHVRQPEDGAVVTFDGCVRNHSHGRRTLYLDYEAYESMALAKMREIVLQIHEKFSIHRVAVAHRLGRLEIGETSV